MKQLFAFCVFLALWLTISALGFFVPALLGCEYYFLIGALISTCAMCLILWRVRASRLR